MRHSYKSIEKHEPAFKNGQRITASSLQNNYMAIKNTGKMVELTRARAIVLEQDIDSFPSGRTDWEGHSWPVFSPSPVTHLTGELGKGTGYVWFRHFLSPSLWGMTILWIANSLRCFPRRDYQRQKVCYFPTLLKVGKIHSL